ncbi:SDR family oxidoreductase [Streptomyces akebiae]|uniref:SDR family oxidoreductase n=1 Tax=Streptomyces akebiae TaxID=2865673 RepID=UPI0021758C24|nr:SDR family oxidoreductase [Streptomyces akebiae]
MTGSSHGIGRAVALRLGAERMSVVVNYRSDKDAADEVVAEIGKAGGRAVAVGADVTAAGAIEELFEVAEREFGGLDVLISNVGLNRPGSIAEVTDEDYDLVFGTNTRATFVALREAARRVRNGGRIVSISSGAAVMARAGSGVYAASKAASDTLVRVLAQELGPRQVTVNSVLPGVTRTDGLMAAPRSAWEPWLAGTPLDRLAEPEDISDIVAFLVSDGGRWITGQAVHASGGAF